MSMGYKARKLTNITKEDFEFSYGGVPFILKAGETQLFYDYVADHGAKHLAHKILVDRRKKSGKILPESYSYLSDADLPAIIASCLGEVVDNSTGENLTPQQKLKKDHDEMNKRFGTAPPLTEHTKKELLEIAEARGLQVDPKMTKDELVKELNTAMATTPPPTDPVKTEMQPA